MQSVRRSCSHLKRWNGVQVAGFDGGHHLERGRTAAGKVDQGLGLVRRFAACFIDRRDPRYVERQVDTLVGQRIFGLALGCEDLNDHDELRKDPMLAVLAGKLRPVLRTDCEPLAGTSTLNRPVPNSNSRVTSRHLGPGEDWDAAVHLEFESAIGVHVVPDQGRDGELVARGEPLGPMGPGENLLQPGDEAVGVERRVDGAFPGKVGRQILVRVAVAAGADHPDLLRAQSLLQCF